MNKLNINPDDIIFSLDIGTRSIIGTVGIIKDKKFTVISEKYLEHQERAMVDGQIHDINLVASSVQKIKSELENEISVQLKNVAIAAAGRMLRTTNVKTELNIEETNEIDKEMIRSLELTAVKKAEEEVKEQTKGKLYCVGYSVKNYYLNGYIISNLLSHRGEKISADVIVTFLPKSVVESLYAVMNKVDLNVISLTLEPIAAMEAAIPQKLRLLNLALVDIGAGTSDIAISSQETIIAYGMVPMAGDEVTEAIAQNYLVDFNTAEAIKRELQVQEEVKYTDVLGLENTIKSQEVLKLILPIIEKISEEIASRIIELNGNKAPNAIFLVGGGAHTPGLKDRIAEKLNLPVQRIAIKGRESVTECVCLDNNLGSIGVTVLGIALISIRNLGHDFIDIELNGSVISLFNSHKHTVMDVMMQSGINPKVLVCKNGKSKRFVLNGIKRVAFGTLGKSASIKVNDQQGSIDTEIKEGDKISIEFAKDGNDATPKVKDYISNVYSISFYINDKIYYMEPLIYINGNKASIEDNINEQDEINIIYPKTLEHLRKHFYNDEQDAEFYINDEKLKDNYVIKEGDMIYTISPNVDSYEEVAVTKCEVIKHEEKTIENTETLRTNNSITVIVNDKSITLNGKEKYIFVDVFNHIDFDLTIAKGIIRLELNGDKASYNDEIKDGDNIKIYWD